jgi:hypothetical protein
MEKLSAELKKAIENLTPLEKDKLLFRLISFKPDLIKKLTFELLEDKETLDTRTTKIQQDIDLYLQSLARYFTPGNLLMAIRGANALITEHVKVTKDKMGEVFLTIHLLSEAFRLWRKELDQFPEGRCITFREYVVKRSAVLMEKAQKLDPMFQQDITTLMNELLHQIYDFPPTQREAEIAKLDKTYVFVGKAKKK